MRAQQTGGLGERGGIVLGVARHHDQIVIIGVEARQKHAGRGVHRTQRGVGLILQFGERLANQRDALSGGIDRSQQALVIQRMGELQGLHQRAGAYGDDRSGAGDAHQHAQQTGLRGRTLQLAGLVGGRTGVGQRIGFTFARVFLGEFPCLGEVGVLCSVHNSFLYVFSRAGTRWMYRLRVAAIAVAGRGAA